MVAGLVGGEREPANVLLPQLEQKMARRELLQSERAREGGRERESERAREGRRERGQEGRLEGGSGLDPTVASCCFATHDNGDDDANVRPLGKVPRVGRNERLVVSC